MMSVMRGSVYKITTLLIGNEYFILFLKVSKINCLLLIIKNENENEKNNEKIFSLIDDLINIPFYDSSVSILSSKSQMTTIILFYFTFFAMIVTVYFSTAY